MSSSEKGTGGVKSLYVDKFGEESAFQLAALTLIETRTNNMTTTFMVFVRCRRRSNAFIHHSSSFQRRSDSLNMFDATVKCDAASEDCQVNCRLDAHMVGSFKC